jgi:hypothetical protein
MDTKDPFRAFARADEIRISSRRSDGTLRPYVPVWGVVVDGALFVRSQAGPNNGWYRRALASGTGRIRAQGAEIDVTFTRAGSADNAAIDAAYRAKYRRYGSIDGIVGPALYDVTLRLDPIAANATQTR